MPIFRDDVLTSRLTAEEKAWCKALEKLLMATPARFGLSTIGDRDIECFDDDAMTARGIDIIDGGASIAKLSLATIRSRVNIHGLCG